MKISKLFAVSGDDVILSLHETKEGAEKNLKNYEGEYIDLEVINPVIHK